MFAISTLAAISWMIATPMALRRMTFAKRRNSLRIARWSTISSTPG